VVRTRSSAAALVTEGHVRLNGERVGAASRPVRAGDVVTVALDRVRILKVIGFAERRGDADAARLLCDDITPISPPREAEAAQAERIPGTGRPTKQERRATDRLLDKDAESR
jgi:ribosome-associated heat shock protein Hsp15